MMSMYQESFDFLNKKILTLPQDGNIDFCCDFYSLSKASELMQLLTKNIQWRSDKIQMYGKLLDQPRLTAWYGDFGTTYTYSKIQMKPEPWFKELLDVKQDIEKFTKTSFNSVLINLYRDGNDHVFWHSDDEPELGKNPIIASLSLGETRRFHFKHKFQKDLKTISMDLNSGSLLIMKEKTQEFWQHRLSPSKKSLEPRINLTFRKIIN